MIHAGDVGTKIRIVPETETDIGSAVSAEIRYQKPSRATGAWSATIVDGALEYVTGAGDIDEPGEWFFQGYVDLVAWAGSSTIVKSKIGKILA
jgi:hypothetical protein